MNVENSRLPDILFKFRDWGNKYHQRILTHNEILFSSTTNFNDPSDSSFPVRFDNIFEVSDKQLIQMGYHFCKENNPDITEEEILKWMKEEMIP